MNIEEKLKQYILSKYKSVRAFTVEVGMPYSTVDNIFKRGISGASITVIIKICRALHIDTDALHDGVIKEKNAIRHSDNCNAFDLSSEALEIAKAYDKLDETGRKMIKSAIKGIKEILQ